MIYVLYGAGGVLLVLALLGIGVLIGWKGKEAWSKHTREAIVAEASEEERRRLKAEQMAFERMLNYNVDTAYGGSRESFSGGEDE